MTESQIEKFICLAGTLNVSRAAEELGISQPALSKQISMLEGSLGFPLFTRERGDFQLTDAGKIMLNGFSRMMSIRANSIERARDADLTNGPNKLRLELTGQWTLENTGEIVRRLRGATGRDGLRLLHDRLRPALKALCEGDADLLITAAAMETVREKYPGCRFMPLFKDELVLLHSGDTDFGETALRNAAVYYVPGACPAAEYLPEFPGISDCNPNLIPCRPEEMSWQAASGDCFGAIGRSDPMYKLPQYRFYETGVRFPVYLAYLAENAPRFEALFADLN